MSSIVNKVKDALPGHKTSEPEGTHGPHNSRAANATDPRVDSDRDHRAAHTSTLGNHGGTYTTSENYSHGPTSRTDGPHNSNLMNKADPRVDSDRDHSKNMGINPHGTATSETYGHSTHSSTVPRNTTTTRSNLPEGTVGPHSSRMANAADPRVDSDLDSTRQQRGYVGGTTTSTTNTRNDNISEGTFGPHSSRVANAADPRVDSDRDNIGTQHRQPLGQPLGHSGPAPNTAGPHKSDMMNKADPRVDSDLDGSKTYGGDKTFSTGAESGLKHKDPTDAAQVPPSVLQKHVGPPTIEHDDHTFNREKRHSVSHQDTHRGL